MSFPQPQQWRTLALTLGLSPYVSSAGFGFGASFRQLYRALAATSEPPSFSHWLCGWRRQREVIVLTYETGGGSASTTWTGAVARIDPPLFLGLGITAHSFLDSMFGSADIRVGHPLADSKLRIEGFDPARIAQLLSPNDPAGYELLSRMVALGRSDNVRASDSLVVISREGTHADPAAVLGMLDPAIDLAEAFGAQRQRMGASPAEVAQQAEWKRFAETSGFAFDPARMKLVGNRAGTAIDIALETEGQRICTAVTARFPAAVPVSFTVLPSALPKFLQGVFGQDIRVGDPEFDDRYRVTGQPEQAVRQALARPGLLAALKHLGARTAEVQLNPWQLFFRLPGPSPRASELEWLVELGLAVSRELFGELKGMGPYR
jgi:hypothetical protein